MIARTTIALSMLCLALGFSTASCADTEESPFAASHAALLDGTPDAVALLSFLNHPRTTVTLLDLTVPLDRRAAEGIIRHRDGLDKLPGTSDDNLFDSVVEVDAVPWVGPAALQRLMDFVASYGLVPEGDDLLGVWEGVAFTVNEAEATLRAANEADFELLDIDAKLVSTAVVSILDARPIVTIPQLARLYAVGPKTLETLRDWSMETSPFSCQAAPPFSPDEFELGFQAGNYMICTESTAKGCVDAALVSGEEMVEELLDRGEDDACIWSADPVCGFETVGPTPCCYVVAVDRICF